MTPIPQEHRLSGEFSNHGREAGTPAFSTPPGGGPHLGQTQFVRSDSAASVFSGCYPSVAPNVMPPATPQQVAQKTELPAPSDDLFSPDESLEDFVAYLGEMDDFDSLLSSDPMLGVGGGAVDPLVKLEESLLGLPSTSQATPRSSPPPAQSSSATTSTGTSSTTLATTTTTTTPNGAITSIDSVVEMVARQGGSGVPSEFTIQRRISSHSMAPSPGNMSHEHNMRAHAFHGGGGGAIRSMSENGMAGTKMANGHEHPNGRRPTGNLQDDLADAQIAEFAKTVSEKDKKIKAAAAEQKAKQPRKSRSKKTTTTNAQPSATVTTTSMINEEMAILQQQGISDDFSSFDSTRRRMMPDGGSAAAANIMRQQQQQSKQ